MCFVSNVFPEAMETRLCESSLTELCNFSPFPPLLPAYNKYMGGVDRLSQMMVLIENRSDTGYVLFFSFFIMPLIMPTYCTNTIASCLICLPKSC